MSPESPQVDEHVIEWRKICDEFDRISSNKDLMTAQKCMNLYSRVTSYCESTYLFMKSSRGFEHQVYQQIREYLVNNIEAVLRDGIDLTGLELLEFHNTAWENFQAFVKHFDFIFSYFKRNWGSPSVRQNKNIPTIYNIAIGLWRKHLLEKVMEKLVSAVIALINIERSGGVINKDYVLVTIECLFDMKRDDETNRQNQLNYEKHFEKKLFRATKKFYMKQSRNFSNSGRNFVDYMLNVEKTLREEEENAGIYFRVSTKNQLLKVIKECLIFVHISFFQKRFAELLISTDDDILSLIYRVCNKVSFGIIGLKNDFHKHVTRKGLETMEKVAADSIISPKLFVENVFELQQSFRKLVLDVFYDGSGFKRSIDAACRLFINSNAVTQRDPRPPQIQVTGTAAELLARYCDQLLDKTSEESRDVDLDDLSNKIMVVLKYIRDKDIFSKLSTLMFSNRLIHDLSVSHDAEITFFAKLTDKDTQESTTKLYEMMIDAKVSEHLTRQFDSKQPVELNVLVMSLSSWPSFSTTELDIPLYQSDETESFRQFYTASWATFPEIQLNLPLQLSNTMDSFHQFFKEKYNNQRSLNWVLSQCHAEVASDAFQTEHLFVVTAAQMCTLLLFNDQDSYTVNQICDATGMDAMTTSQVVGSLIEQQVLKAESDSADKGISMSAIISLNENFTSEEVRVDLAKLIVKNEQERQFEKLQANLTEDRMSFIKASIVNILKQCKGMGKSELIRQVLRQTSEQYKPRIRDIELCLQMLMEEMEVSSVGESPNTAYDYVF